jgi:Fe-S cluster biogenesis protein NfuA
MPKIADIQETPNPNAVKFILKEPVSHGTSHSFKTPEDAEGNELAKSLFDIGNVVSIAAALDDNPQVREIEALLDERIRPYLAGDGGWVEVAGFENKTLKIRYEGACGSCPSSLTGTLMAIENMIKDEIDPEIEVITV